MDKIFEAETILISNKIQLRNISMTLAEKENRMLKEVELEAKAVKDPALSNAELRRIAVRERLIMDDEYAETLCEKLRLEEIIMYGEAKVAELKRAYIVEFCQNKLPI